MMHNAEEIKGFSVQAEDGKVGECKDFLLDNLLWVTRYFVVQTQLLGSYKKVIVSPLMVKGVDWKNKRLFTNSTRDKFSDGPEMEEEKRITRKEEADWLEYYDLPLYWTKQDFVSENFDNLLGDRTSLSYENMQNTDESYLRSSNEMIRFRIQTNDGKFGEIRDFLLDYPFWAVRYSVVDTGSYLPGRKVVIPTNWIYCVNLEEKIVGVDLSIEDIKESPQFDPAKPINRDFETKFFDHFERPKYWA